MLVMVRHARALGTLPFPTYTTNLDTSVTWIIKEICQNLDPVDSEKTIFRFVKFATGPVVGTERSLPAPVSIVPKLLALTTHASCARNASLLWKIISSPSVVPLKLRATVMYAPRAGTVRQRQHVTILNVSVNLRVRNLSKLILQIYSIFPQNRCNGTIVKNIIRCRLM